MNLFLDTFQYSLNERKCAGSAQWHTQGFVMLSSLCLSSEKNPLEVYSFPALL